MLEYVKFMQTNWVNQGNTDISVKSFLSHNVSNTVTVDEKEWDAVSKYIYANRQHFAGISLLGKSGSRDYRQAPFQEVLTPTEIASTYGDASLFASGLIIHALQAFGDLYVACDCFLGIGQKLEQLPNLDNGNLPESIDMLHDLFKKRTWLLRAKKFTERYFAGNKRQMTYCLKDVDTWKHWVDLRRDWQEVDWTKFQEDKDNTKREELVACANGMCTITKL
jgi:ribonucleoside-triphosphate reductase